MNKKIYKLNPIYSLIKLALLSYYPDNTKLSISDNSIYIRTPSMVQGLLRWSNGENRYDILSLYKIILEAIKILNDTFNFNNYDFLLYYVCCGINKLILCYVEDKKIKLQLQDLEKKLNKFYNNKKIELNINIYKKSYNWEKVDIEFINSNFKTLNILNKINVFDIKKRNELKNNYLLIIDNYIETKNSKFL